MVKKIAIALGCLFAIALIAIITVPMFVDVDKYRPQIEQAANEQINGSLELGKLHLSLWGGVYVKADSIALTIKGEKKPAVSADQFYLQIPFFSLLLGGPAVTAVLDAPEISIVSDRAGKINLMNLIKETKGKPAAKSAAPAGTANAAAKSSDSGKSAGADSSAESKTAAKSDDAKGASASAALPAFLVGASLGVSINEGKLSYKDEKTGEKIDVNGVELDLMDVGLTKTIKFYLSVPLDVKMKAAKVKGTFVANAKFKPVLAGAAVRAAKGFIEVDASDLNIDAGVFKKADRVPVTLKANFDGTENDFKLLDAELQFHTLKLTGGGAFIHAPKMEYEFNFKTPQNFDLASFGELVAMLNAYELKGSTSISANIEGAAKKMRLKSYIKINNGSVAYPDLLKQPLKFTSKIALSENAMDMRGTKITANNFDLTLMKAQVVSFKKPMLRFMLDSKEMNLDDLIDQSKLGAKKQAALLPRLLDSLIATAVAAGEAKPVMVNPMYEMSKNPVLKSMTGEFKASIRKLVYQKTPITNINLLADLDKLRLNVSRLDMAVFGGKINAKANADLATKRLGFRSNGSVSGISGKEAITTYMPKLQNTLEGKLSANWNIRGFAYPQPDLMKSLDGKVNLTAKNGRLRSFDFKDSINGAISKVPFLKGKSAPDIDSSFRSFRSDIALKGGVIQANPIVFKGSDKSIDFNGKSTIQASMDQETFIDVFDPNKRLPQDISHGSERPSLALRFSGPLASPKPDYGYTAQRLAQNAAKKHSKKLIKKGLDKVLGGDKKGGGGLDKLKKKFKLPF